MSVGIAYGTMETQDRPEKIQAILVDLDNTLYPPECGLLAAGDERITQFIQRRLKMPREQADRERLRLWRKYGTTAHGLAVEYGIPEVEMCREALETMDVGTLVRPDPELRKAIESLAVPAHVFTNSTRRYAMNVLEALGVAGVFAEIFDIEFLQWQGKPSAEAFRRVLNALKLPAPVVALAEDDAASLEMGAKLGMVTIAVGVDGPARFRVRNIKQLPAFLGRAGLL